MVQPKGFGSQYTSLRHAVLIAIGLVVRQRQRGACLIIGENLMALAHKYLWIVKMDTQVTETQFAKHALAIGASGVCIRTSSTRLATSIKNFKQLGLRVYGWRWPSATTAGATAEANRVAGTLIPAGLDGYIVDPESDGPGANDWNQPGLGPLAANFCKIIRTAGGKKFVIGTTSGCAYPAPGGKPNIPWKEFFAASDILLPQTYWRWTNKGKVSDINGGTPAKAIKRGMAAWQPKSQVTPILPMLGEADVVTPQEIANYGNELAGWKVSEGHFYADNGQISVANLAAMQAL